MDPQARPRFHKARPIPYALREKVDIKLERLPRGVSVPVPVEFSQWAAPVVPVLKEDGSVRLCGDYRTTVNQVLERDSYPLPRIEDLFSTLAGGQSFTKLDLRQACQQVQLDEQSKEYVTINTHRGLFRYNRMPFGISSAPSVFQRIMDSLLHNITGAIVYLDDILITGITKEEHLKNLEETLCRLAHVGLKLKRGKCQFLQSSVQLLGYQIDAKGLHPTEDKVRAIKAAPKPTNVAEFRSYLGLLNYYGRFLPNLSSQMKPLYNLLAQGNRGNGDRSERRPLQSHERGYIQIECLLTMTQPRNSSYAVMSRLMVWVLYYATQHQTEQTSHWDLPLGPCRKRSKGIRS